MQGRHQAENHLGAEAKNQLFSLSFFSLSFFLKTSSYLTVAISAPISGGVGHARGDGGHRRGQTSPATSCPASSTVWMSSLSTLLAA